MMKKILTTLLLLLGIVATAGAENWDYIVSSGEYYFGTGTAESEEAADEAAMVKIMGQMEADVQYVRTYRQALRATVQHIAPVRKGEQVTARLYMKRSDLPCLFESRVTKAKDMVAIADDCLQSGKIDMALQYYYWAYSLVRTVQHPDEVSVADRQLTQWIPEKISEILNGISITFDKREDEYVHFIVTSGGKPVSSLEFTYNDGDEDCTGIAKDGRGMIELAEGYTSATCRIDIECEYRERCRGDKELRDVLKVVPPYTFPMATHTIQTSGAKVAAHQPAEDNTGLNLTPKPTQTVANAAAQSKALALVIDAITKRNYAKALPCFTPDGKEMYNRLITYGSARIVGTPRLDFFRGMNGTTVARGLQMSFTFMQAGRKTTFVEDVAFTFNHENKIENVAFGLGNVVENDILCREAAWKDETREMLMEFLENYKTAYCLKRLEYIRSIFADDAVIIVGNVARPRVRPNERGERLMTNEGKNIIRETRYTKNEYLKNLDRCFKRNEFINVRFSTSDIQWLDKYKDEEIFGIQLGQEYTSSSYSDKGYLFLLVDMTNHDEPLIKIRTWQPNELSRDQIYNAGNFYKN